MTSDDSQEYSSVTGVPLKEKFEEYHHDTCAMLARILATVALLERKISGPLTSLQEESLQSIRGNCYQLQLMADNLLEWSGTRMARSHEIEIHLNQEIREAMERFSGVAAMKEIHLEANCPHFEVFIHGPGNAIGRILDNLLSNALRHTPEKGRVTISLGKKEDRIDLKVSDTGGGIPSGELESLFERGFRGDPTKLHQGIGKGLGLFISQQLAESMGATLHVESELGKGSTFQIIFPEYRSAEVSRDEFEK